MIDFLKRIRESGEIRIPFLNLNLNQTAPGKSAAGRASARSVARGGESSPLSPLSLFSVFDKFRGSARSSQPAKSPSMSDGMNPGAYSARTIGVGLAALKAKGEKPPEEPKVVETPPEE
jgi:hypothetical protein